MEQVTQKNTSKSTPVCKPCPKTNSRKAKVNQPKSSCKQQQQPQQYQVAYTRVQDDRQYVKNYAKQPNYKNSNSSSNNSAGYSSYANESRPQSNNYSKAAYKNSPTKGRGVQNNRSPTYYSGYSTQPSSGESEALRNEMDEFKIVQNGAVIHSCLSSESEEDYQNELKHYADEDNLSSIRFATSLSTIGPNGKDISMPGFLMVL